MYRRFLCSATMLGCLLFIQLPSVWAETPEGSSLRLSERGPLVDMVRLVINRHPRAQSIDASLLASSARYQAADQPIYNPELEIDAERTDINTTSLGFSQSIDWSDKRGTHARTASYDHAALNAESDLARQGLAIELLKALSEYHTANDLNKLGLQHIQLMQKFSAISEKRHQAGDLNQVELDLARIAALEANLESAELAARLSDAEQALISLFGEIPIPETWPMLPQSLHDIQQYEVNSEKLLRSHPAFKAQLAHLMVARSLIELRQRETRPDPTISIRAGREDKETMTGLTLSVPLYIRNNYQAEVSEANANLAKAEQDAQTAWLNLMSQLNSAVRRYTLTYSTWTEWQQRGVTSLNRRTEVLEQLWRTGEMEATDYLVQVKQSLDTQGAATDLRGRLWQTWLDWLAASGTVFKWLDIEINASTVTTHD
jgi:cobalt-zinc-cadmium efflux system outer membrane protein